MQICGVDDAGRGSMLGPLVIAGISLDKRKLRKLSSLGVKDSKKLSPKSREYLYKKMIEIADAIREGSNAYLKRQNQTLTVFVLIMAVLLWILLSFQIAVA